MGALTPTHKNKRNLSHKYVNIFKSDPSQPYLLFTPMTEQQQGIDKWHFTNAPSSLNISQFVSCRERSFTTSRVQVWGQWIKWQSSDGYGQPASDQEHAPVRSQFPQDRVLRQGLVIQGATERPHAHYQEGARLQREEGKVTVCWPFKTYTQPSQNVAYSIWKYMYLDTKSLMQTKMENTCGRRNIINHRDT